ncbi:HAMP domain-containing histidine kinase [Flavobacterium sp. NRK F10]|uniref:histidine kinase n=1 Tax=Flavobacterium sediminis TaxID=2201181 RepID=A0A2U8QWF4_9FLAO|nr:MULTISPECIES: HAMP domain-containing sensor histidine kinase [Flavobacterium]AWM14542.1 two-component sensor histidine kinase [Flavobacterium sediminis]MCO6175777.1 HAMP domain-containing histidine kinase [Flavobacterium sp. NRK F10]
MNKTRFRLLALLMSLSLIGIITVQLYWINTSLRINDEQFKYQVQQVVSHVAENVNSRELKNFITEYNKIKDSIGKEPETNVLKEILFYEKDIKTNETIIYTSTLVSENYGINGSFFDKNADSLWVKNIVSNRKTEVYNGDVFDNNHRQLNKTPDITIRKSGSLSSLDKANFELAMKDIVSARPIQSRISAEELHHLLKTELDNYGIKTPFEFGIYSNGLATKVRSESFKYDKNKTYGIPIFKDGDGKVNYQLLVSFPQKSKFVFSKIFGLTLLSLLFTLVIVLTYMSALKQLIKQKQISEIKTDFINNMTHEFKTPIATINLALDAIKNPKIIEDKDKVQRYLQMIKDENKRMHAQVENVLRISKLEKNELDINKEPTDVMEVLENAIEHVSLLIEDRDGTITKHLEATRTTILLNESHFTNVLVNILDNAIKYSPNAPVIDVYTENIKDYILIKIQDQGAGMSKVAQKRVFEKFYREHTGDLHNVKGHGLGLAYVKQIVEDHNGQIYVESEKGKGSTFIIKMPLIN